MAYYFLVCRSLTYAQRGKKLLDASGIAAAIQRTPQEISPEGCGYGLKIKERVYRSARSVLSAHQIKPKQVFRVEESGAYEEVLDP